MHYLVVKPVKGLLEKVKVGLDLMKVGLDLMLHVVIKYVH